MTRLPALIRSQLRGRSNLMFGVADQGVSSLTNLGLNVAVAATSSTETYGALGLVMALYLLEFGVVYGAVVEPYSVVSNDERRRTTGSAVAAATVVGCVLTAVHLLVAAVASGVVSTYMLAFALATPGLILQVAARGVLIAQGRSRVALVSNVAWGVVQVVLTGAAIGLDFNLGIFLAWAAGAWTSAAVCLWSARTAPRLRSWRSWFEGRLRLAVSWTGDHLAQSGLAQILVFCLLAVAGLNAVGAYRGALQFAGPATVVVAGIRQVFLPGAARRARSADDSLRRAIDQLALLFPLVTLVLVGPFLLVPTALGEAAFGDTWAGARAVLPWIIVMRMATSAGTAFATGLRATHEVRATLYLRVGGGTATLATATVAGALHGASGAAAAMAVVAIVLVPLWWRAFTRRAREYRTEMRLRAEAVLSTSSTSS
jgi:O-antigen/teichoic acid export membrane protein